MSEKEIISFIEDRPWVRSSDRLEKMSLILKELHNPQKKLKYIHVAGTNGKGSCCALLTSILIDSGYKVGTYTSPHLIKYNERFCINNIPVSNKELGLIIKDLKQAFKRLDFVPSVFETLTAIAFEYFKREKVDVVVLEVGLGGRYDATNIIDKSQLSILMNIGLEHTEVLGKTLEKIAYEKSGIIKENGDVLSYDNSKKVIKVFKEVAKEKKARLKVVNFDLIKIKEEGLDHQIFDYGHLKNIELGLLGRHQFYNAAVVIEAIKILRKKGYNISNDNLRNGLKNVKWNARLEILSKNPLFILDGAHNPQCVSALKKSLPFLIGKKKAYFIFGSLTDKDYLKMIDMVAPYAKEFICFAPNSNRALKASKLAMIIKKKGIKATCASSCLEAIEKAYKKTKKDDVIIAFGSLYLAGEIKDEFNKYLGL